MRTVTLTLGRIRRHIATGAASVDELGDEITGRNVVLHLSGGDAHLPGQSLNNYVIFLRGLGARAVTVNDERKKHGEGRG